LPLSYSFILPVVYDIQIQYEWCHKGAILKVVQLDLSQLG